MSNGSPVFPDELFQRSDRGLQINCLEMETTVDEEERCSNALNVLELEQLSPFFPFIFIKQK